MNLIVERTSEFNTPEFDYPKLGEKIASFEVNGFLNKEEIAPYKKLVDRFVRIGYVVSFIFFVAFIVLFLIIAIAIGKNVVITIRITFGVIS